MFYYLKLYVNSVKRSWNIHKNEKPLKTNVEKWRPNVNKMYVYLGSDVLYLDHEFSQQTLNQNHILPSKNKKK